MKFSSTVAELPHGAASEWRRYKLTYKCSAQQGLCVIWATSVQGLHFAICVWCFSLYCILLATMGLQMLFHGAGLLHS
jgi:hypothetical protein